MADEGGRFYRKEGINRTDVLRRPEERTQPRVEPRIEPRPEPRDEYRPKNVWVNQRFGGPRPPNHHWRPYKPEEEHRENRRYAGHHGPWQGRDTRGGWGQGRENWGQGRGNGNEVQGHWNGGRNQQNWNPPNRNQQNRYQQNRDQQNRGPARSWIETTNADFSTVIKSAYRHCQLRHHEKIWQALPNKVEKMMKDAFDTITPPFPDDELRGEILKLKDETNHKIKELTQKHIERVLKKNEETLGRLNPEDKNQALRIVFRQLTKNLTRMTPEEKDQFLTEADDKLTGGRGNSGGNSGGNLEGNLEGNSSTEDKNKEKETEEIAMETLDANRKRVREEANRTDTRDDVEGDNDDNSEEEGAAARRPAPNNPTKKPCNTKSPKDKQFIHSSILRPEVPTLETLTQKTGGVSDMNPTNIHRVGNQGIETKSDWMIQPLEDTFALIIGDSNLKLAKAVPAGYETHVFPGLNLDHATILLTKLQKLTTPLKIAVSVGINNRDTPPMELDILIQKILTASTTGPHEVLMTGVPISGTQSREQDNNIKYLNDGLEKAFGEWYVGPIPQGEITISKADLYQIHHTQETTDKVMKSILSFLEQ